jgi:hypothetical protein
MRKTRTMYNFSNAEFAKSNIYNKRIKLSLLKDLNDPYEFFVTNISLQDLDVYKQSFEYGMLCFSSTYESPIMWSHYADRHKGICLIFEVLEENIIPVNYLDKPKKIDLKEKKSITPIDVQSIISNKSNLWKYENECRIFSSLDHQIYDNGNFFEPFSDSLKLAGVILGAYCSESESTIKSLLSNYPYPVNVKRARLSKAEFKVILPYQ